MSDSKIVVILQSNYIPWKGYFDLLNSADLFIFHDDLQYTKGDWRNRNKIKTPKGTEWLTIPAGSSENRLICEVEIQDQKWKLKHKNIVKQYYSKASYFNKYSYLTDFLYNNSFTNLSEFNQQTIKFIAKEVLGSKTEFKDTRSMVISGSKTERVVDICVKAGATKYISGPAGRNYLDKKQFDDVDIELDYFSYDGYKEYPQLYPPFEHAVSIIDLLYNCGDDYKEYMLTF